MDFHPFPPRPDSPRAPRMVKAIAQALAVFMDGSFLIAAYELADWDDEASPADETAMVEAVIANRELWKDQCEGADNVMTVIYMVMPDGFTRRSVIVDRHRPCEQEFLI